MSDPKPGDYEVGYQKPPQRTQWKKGQSGNPRGKPKRKDRSFIGELRSVLAETVSVMENGRKVKLSKMSLIFKQLVNKAAKGDNAGIRLLLHFIHLSERWSQQFNQLTPDDVERIIAQLEKEIASNLGGLIRTRLLSPR